MIETKIPTAVGFLIHHLQIDPSNPLVKQATALEKQQHILTWVSAIGSVKLDGKEMGESKDFKDYYTQTYR